MALSALLGRVSSSGSKSSSSSADSSEKYELVSDSESDCSEEEDVSEAFDGWYSCFKGDEVRRFLPRGVGESRAGGVLSVGVDGVLWTGGGGGEASSRDGLFLWYLFMLSGSGLIDSLKGRLVFSGVLGARNLGTSMDIDAGFSFFAATTSTLPSSGYG